MDGYGEAFVHALEMKGTYVKRIKLCLHNLLAVTVITLPA
jgi:hypothetical protein